MNLMKMFCFNLKKKGLYRGLFMKTFKDPYDLYFYQPTNKFVLLSDCG